MRQEKHGACVCARRLQHLSGFSYVAIVEASFQADQMHVHTDHVQLCNIAV